MKLTQTKWTDITYEIGSPTHILHRSAPISHIATIASVASVAPIPSIPSIASIASIAYIVKYYTVLRIPINIIHFTFY